MATAKQQQQQPYTASRARGYRTFIFSDLVSLRGVVVDEELEVRVVPSPSRGRRGVRVVGGLEVAVGERVRRLKGNLHPHLERTTAPQEESMGLEIIIVIIIIVKK